MKDNFKKIDLASDDYLLLLPPHQQEHTNKRRWTSKNLSTMPISEELYKKILIPINKKRTVSKASILVSPLITNFERWSGKKIKLQRSEIEPINLQNNVFANILASPVRLDRVSKTRLPRLLLNQINLNLKDKDLKLGAGKALKEQHSYVLTPLRILQKNVKAAATLLPLHVLSSGKLNLSSMKMDTQTMLTSYKAELLQELTKQLTCLKPNPDGDITLTYDKNNSQTVFFAKNSRGSIQLCFNLSLLDAYEPLHKAWQGDSIHILSRENIALLIQVYKVLKFLQPN